MLAASIEHGLAAVESMASVSGVREVNVNVRSAVALPYWDGGHRLLLPLRPIDAPLRERVRLAADTPRPPLRRSSCEGADATQCRTRRE